MKPSRLVWTQPAPSGGTIARVWLHAERYHWDVNPCNGCCIDPPGVAFDSACEHSCSTKGQAIKRVKEAMTTDRGGWRV